MDVWETRGDEDLRNERPKFGARACKQAGFVVYTATYHSYGVAERESCTLLLPETRPRQVLRETSN